MFGVGCSTFDVSAASRGAGRTGDREQITNNIPQAYETKMHFEERSEVEFTRNCTRVIRGNNRALCRLLEVD
jgi:hypothetical protein